MTAHGTKDLPLRNNCKQWEDLQSLFKQQKMQKNQQKQNLQWLFIKKCLVSREVPSYRGPNIITLCCVKPIGVFGPPVNIFPRKWKKMEVFKDAPKGIYPVIPLSVQTCWVTDLCTSQTMSSQWKMTKSLSYWTSTFPNTILKPWPFAQSTV
jgi:hypothetical protein